jgi:hypothetical protein
VSFFVLHLFSPSIVLFEMGGGGSKSADTTVFSARTSRPVNALLPADELGDALKTFRRLYASHCASMGLKQEKSIEEWCDYAKVAAKYTISIHKCV